MPGFERTCVGRAGQGRAGVGPNVEPSSGQGEQGRAGQARAGHHPRAHPHTAHAQAQALAGSWHTHTARLHYPRGVALRAHSRTQAPLQPRARTTPAPSPLGHGHGNEQGTASEQGKRQRATRTPAIRSGVRTSLCATTGRAGQGEAGRSRAPSWARWGSGLGAEQGVTGRAYRGRAFRAAGASRRACPP